MQEAAAPKDTVASGILSAAQELWDMFTLGLCGQAEKLCLPVLTEYLLCVWCGLAVFHVIRAGG